MIFENSHTPSAHPQSESVLQAEVICVPENVNIIEEQRFPTEIEEELYPVETQMSPNLDRPLFITLYIMLLLAITGLVFSLSRSIQVSRDARPLPSSQEATTSKVVSNGETSPLTLAIVDPDRDPVTYRSEIQDIVSTEIHEEFFTSFLEGAQKKAIDWLVHDDLVLTSMQIRAMVESRNSNEFVGDNLVPTFPLVQRYVMMVLFFETNGELWSESPWTEMVNITECRFIGVECDLEGQAVVLDLSHRKLRGRLPEEVGMLTKLEAVSFFSNSLEGTIPSFIYNKLTNLNYLDLSKNKFSSTISSDISKLTSLHTLSLNELSLIGQVPIDAMKSLSTLEQLSITYATKMSGPLLEFSESWPNLTSFDIYQSEFTGTIPADIGMNTKLEVLWLEDTPMDVSNIPTAIGLLTNLQQLVLGSTTKGIDGGTIPTELGNCQAMKYLQINGRHFSGSIPTELGRLTNMLDLTLEGGMITGSIPSELGQLTKLTELSFVGNRLEGTLPSELGKLQDLYSFRIYINDLTGRIPSDICNNTLVTIDRDCSIDKCKCCYIPCRKVQNA